MLSNNAYDIINKIQRFLPALGAFYLVLVEVWGLPFGNEINKTVVALATLLAVFLEIMTSKWNKENSISITNFKELAEQLEEEEINGED